MRLRIIHVRSERRSDLPMRRSFETADIQAVPIARFARFHDTDENQVFVIDVDLRDEATVRVVRPGLERNKHIRSIFVVDPANRAQEIQAQSMGAATLVYRPIDAAALELALRCVVPSTDMPAMDAAPAGGGANLGPPMIAAGAQAMSELFHGFHNNSPPQAESLQRMSENVDDEIDAVGLDRWLSTVRNHHRGTYQHSLLVSGLASRFGVLLGLPASERQVLTGAALIHDIGKIRIPTELLDKIGALTDAEFAIVRKHPLIGAAYLAGAGLDPRIVSAVRHHHEMLDGSGYPDGLVGVEIPSIVRLVTICDIFGAMVEQRSYKLPAPADVAYATLEAMTAQGKLDAALVAAFRTTAAEVTTTRVTVAMDAPSSGTGAAYG